MLTSVFERWRRSTQEELHLLLKPRPLSQRLSRLLSLRKDDLQ